MRRRNVPIDFVSWHLYAADPQSVAKKADEWRKLIDECGYTAAESHLTEWNYIRGWRGGEYAACVRDIGGVRGAAFAASFMCVAQRSPVDLMTYYDARPSAYNGLFDPADNSPRPSYWAFDAWRSLRTLSSAVSTRVDDASGQVRSAASCNGVRFAVLVVRFSGDLNQAATCGVSVDLGGIHCEGLSVKTLDSRHDFQSRPAALCCGKLDLALEPWALALVEGRLTGKVLDPNGADDEKQN